MGRPARALLLLAALASAMAISAGSAVAPVAGTGDEWMVCQHGCNCKWVSGKKTADCSRHDFNAVPHSLSGQIQSLDLSKNKVRVLPRATFRSVGLVNLHKITLEGCGLGDVHEDAFQGLAILTELDLSNNNITWLMPSTFRDTQRIRVINLRDNKIRSVPNGLFNNLSFLQRVDLSKCQLDHVGSTAFHNVPALTELILSENRLTTLSLDAVQSLARLTGLVLHANPWRCDCDLRPLRDWAIDRKLYAPPTKCAEPEHLGNRYWSDLNSTDFACRPEILTPSDGSTVEAYAGDVTLVCKVSGDPPPLVHWVHNGRVMSNNSLSVYGENRFIVNEGGYGLTRWANLTIRQARALDRGVFNCVAKSPGGVDERSVTMLVGAGGLGGADVGPMLYAWPLVLGLASGAAVLFAVLLLLCCFCYKRRHIPERRAQTKKTHPGEAANGSISVRDADEKSLLTVVNPVQKPPRRHESPSAGTELGDLGRNLLEDPTALGADEEGRSLDSVTGTTPQRSDDGADRHPPDLLAFGARSQHSPTGTGSTGSTAPLGNGGVPYSPGPGSLYGRTGPPPMVLPLPSPAASLPSPAAMSPGLMCGTLPYSRSQSPFSPPLGAPKVQSRTGYVTIPRRPRVPSWSSVPPTPVPMEDTSSLHKSPLDPVYDNMGPRTTADGSSKLSLLEGSTPRRPFPGHYVTYDVGRPASVASMASVSSSTPLTNGSSSTIPRAVKVPPKPPPKPKKKAGPLYEDETEDGTEV